MFEAHPLLIEGIDRQDLSDQEQLYSSRVADRPCGLEGLFLGRFLVLYFLDQVRAEDDAADAVIDHEEAFLDWDDLTIVEEVSRFLLDFSLQDEAVLEEDHRVFLVLRPCRTEGKR